MKKKAILWVCGILVLGVVAWNLSAAGEEKEQRQEIYIGKGYTVAGVALKEGKYLVIHRPAAEAEGKECTYFYKMPYRSDKEPAVKLRCTPGQSAAVKEFTLRSVSQSDGSSAVKSIQFANSTEVHNFGTGS